MLDYMVGPRGIEPRYLVLQTSAIEPSLPETRLFWWRISDSNRSPSACKADALPDELIPRCLVQDDGFEPPTDWV